MSAKAAGNKKIASRAAAQRSGRPADRIAEDRSALRMMLAYIETECRRVGAERAARHAAMAAALMPDLQGTEGGLPATMH